MKTTGADPCEDQIIKAFTPENIGCLAQLVDPRGVVDMERIAARRIVAFAKAAEIKA